MSPTRLALIWLGLSLLPAALLHWYPSLRWVLLASAIGFLALSLLDWLRLRSARTLTIERRISRSLSLGRWHDTQLRLHYSGPFALHTEVYDLHPAEFDSRGLPASLRMTDQHHLNYQLRPRQRGNFRLDGVDCRFRAQAALWRLKLTVTAESALRVYPDFAARRHATLLASASQRAGARKRQRRGDGSDFHQLRDFRDGDPLRCVDWKATSRLQKLIAREYQQQRDQRVMLLIDCSRRMRHRDGHGSHLDETLNAALLMAHTAIRQGDAVGVMTTGGIDRYLPPVKGVNATRQLLNTIYDLASTHASADYRDAASTLMTRHSRRALIIWLTNTRNEESAELIGAVRMLRRRHLVVLADLREHSTDRILAEPVATLDQALSWTGAAGYRAARREFHDQLKASGAQTLDVLPAQLSAELISQYHQIKQLGRL